MTTLKYKIYIDTLIRQGEPLPALKSPSEQDAYRFVFSSAPERNHLPVCVSNPRRVLPPGIKISGYALSCFSDEQKAEARFVHLRKTFKLISKTIGDSIAFGQLNTNDGLISEPDIHTSHFDFYEFASCDASQIFTLKRALI